MLLWSFTWEFLSECGAISGPGDGFPGAVLTERWNSPGMAGARITEALCRKLIIGCYRARGQTILYEVDGIRTFLRKSESPRKLVRLRLAGRKSTPTQRYDIQPHCVEKFKISNDPAPPNAPILQAINDSQIHHSNRREVASDFMLTLCCVQTLTQTPS
jgi:hypothetical protein